ncbi:MetQ/NlpA family ABC transporter substrate-binding protein [Estrella lausannensis]|uniref:ABC transporter substrate binding protein yaeC n=1 Tax=Estrella lausannensis TaxID=483423 RepID=A0A0H5DSM9_9BACT|nr:MetQ/NlpA family ABC transporter substrate-binding protein [Estrella lausannensis]CRX39318.1 ABC transporter substrate binding protein yaeC [Estrella lausannensis]
MNKRRLAFAVNLLLLLSGCSSPENGFKVAATPQPHAQMLDFVKPELKAQGIDLIIVITDDYNLPNRALANNEVAANFFQHLPFMEEQVKQFQYPIVSLAKIELEPMGIYSKKIRSLSELKDNAIVAVPNDPTNEARALNLLHEQGIIQLDNPANLQATILNITHNPKHIKFIEVDAAMLPRSLEDVDAAAINTNYALEAKLSPLEDALALESKDSPFANIIAIRAGDENRPEIKALKAAMTSEKMREFILNKYKGAIIPAF